MLYAPQRVELVLERTGPITRAKKVKSAIIEPLAANLL